MILTIIPVCFLCTALPCVGNGRTRRTNCERHGLMKTNGLGLMWVILASAGYACLSIFTRAIYGNSDLRPTDIALIRFVLATPAIWLLLSLRWRLSACSPLTSNPPFPPWRQSFLGILYAGAALCAVTGLQFVPASLYVVLFFTYPAMVAILSRLRGEHISRAGWVALVCTLIGITLTIPDFSGLQPEMALGIAIALLNALLVAIYFLVVGSLTRRGSNPSLASAWVITGTLVVLLFVSPFFGGVHLPPDASIWLLLIGLGIVSTALPILFMQIGIQRVGAPTASIISTFEPVLAMILAMILLGESILLTQWVGAAFIVAAVFILQQSRMRKRRAIPTA